MTEPIVCAVPSCESLRRKREWCGKHYQAWRRHGDPTVHKYEWVARGGSCVGCGSANLMAGNRRYCSKACAQAVKRARGGRPELVDMVNCVGCGGEIKVGRRDGRRLGRVNTLWCGPCKAQRQKHGISAQAIAQRDGDLCAECDRPVDLTLDAPDPMGPSIDRRIPQSRGGSDEPGNLRLVHRVCNQIKGDLLADEQLIKHCTTPGCIRPLNNRAMGLCRAHMQILQRAGRVPTSHQGHKAYVRLSA